MQWTPPHVTDQNGEFHKTLFAKQNLAMHVGMLGPVRAVTLISYSQSAPVLVPLFLSRPLPVWVGGSFLARVNSCSLHGSPPTSWRLRGCPCATLTGTAGATALRVIAGGPPGVVGMAGSAIVASVGTCGLI